MLRRVIGKELLDCVYGYRSLVVFILATTLFSIAVATGAQRYQTALQEFRFAKTAERQRVAEPNNLYALGNFGIDIVKPPALLSIFVSGVEFHAPRVFNVDLYKVPESRGSTAEENLASAVFGPLDLAFIVEVVLGMAAILFTFSTICGEKENGTLKLQLANALPKDVLLVGKLIGNLIGLLVPVGLAFLVGFALLLDFRDISVTRDAVIRIALLGIGFLLYLTVLFALGVFVSTLTARSTTAFALSLVAWVLLVAIVPRLAVLAARQISPVEPLQEFEMKKTEVHRRGSIEAQKELNTYVRQHDGESVPDAVYYDLLRRVREKQNRELKILDDDYLQQKQRQERWDLILSRLSPAGSVSYAAMSLAQTGLQRDLRFQAAVRDYRAIFTRYYDRKSDELVNQSENRQDLSDLPDFNFQDEPLSASLDRALPDLGFLVVWCFVLFAGAYVNFLRYDVR